MTSVDFKGLKSHRLFLQPQGIKLKINNRKKFGEFMNTWKLMLINNQWVKKVTRGKLENILRYVKMKQLQDVVEGMPRRKCETSI